jgi:hypothetical protein
MTSEMRELGTCRLFLLFALVFVTRPVNRANAPVGGRIGEHHQFRSSAEGICEVRQSKTNRETLVTSARAALPKPESAGDLEGAPSQDYFVATVLATGPRPEQAEKAVLMTTTRTDSARAREGLTFRNRAHQPFPFVETFTMKTVLE